jgi:REP element-mobilizing transposase RayT
LRTISRSEISSLANAAHEVKFKYEIKKLISLRSRHTFRVSVKANSKSIEVQIDCRIKICECSSRMAKRPKQMSFEKVNGWGGKRTGAGRPNFTNTVNHMKRPRVRINEPLHLTMRLKDKLPSLRKPTLLKEFKKSIRNAKEFGLFVLHFAVEENHIHIIVEAKSQKDLANGMRSLGGRFGRILRMHAESRNGKSARKDPGAVFAGRYHIHVLKTPTEMRNALKYVLLNHAKHLKLIDHIDYFSSGPYFSKWKALLGPKASIMVIEQLETRRKANADAFIDSSLSPPQSWLARVGWLRAVA